MISTRILPSTVVQYIWSPDQAWLKQKGSHSGRHDLRKEGGTTIPCSTVPRLTGISTTRGGSGKWFRLSRWKKIILLIPYHFGGWAGNIMGLEKFSCADFNRFSWSSLEGISSLRLHTKALADGIESLPEIGASRRFSEKLDLLHMAPRNELVPCELCLAMKITNTFFILPAGTCWRLIWRMLLT